jgi:hypothetical protein
MKYVGTINDFPISKQVVHIVTIKFQWAKVSQHVLALGYNETKVQTFRKCVESGLISFRNLLLNYAGTTKTEIFGKSVI